MSLYRRAAKRDAIEPEIVQALRAAGCRWGQGGAEMKHKPDLWTAVYALAFLGLAFALTRCGGWL